MKAFKMNKDLMSIINEARGGIPYGIVHLDLKIHDGELITVDTTKHASHKTPKGNTEALSIVTSLFKSVITGKESANLTFTVTFNKGDATRILVQDVKRTAMKE
jgi:hypothetical protein